MPMRQYAKYLLIIPGIILLCGASESSCSPKQTSTDIQRDQQEVIVAEGTMKTGMPAIANFRERKLLKEILELRDQTGFITYTYEHFEYGKRRFLCQSVGYPIPYSTQYTAPETMQRYNIRDHDGNWSYGTAKMPQADPNGLYSPSSAEGTWVLCKDPGSDKIAPIYVEARVITSPFKLDE